MKAEEIYYNDGHHITVTNTLLKVKNTAYQLKSITRHSLTVISPPRFLQLSLITLGTLVFISGSLNLYPAILGNFIKFFSIQLETHLFLMSIGLILFGIGMIILWALKERYAVRIQTQEGEKDVVVSKNRENVAMIVDALNRANLNLSSVTEQKRPSSFTASSR